MNRAQRRAHAKQEKRLANIRPSQRAKEVKVLLNPVDTAISRAATPPLAEQQRVRKACLASFDIMRQGKMTKQEWFDLAEALNLAHQLARMGICSNHVDTIASAMEVMMAVQKRVKAGGNWTCYAQELDAVDLALKIYEIQMNRASVNEILEAGKRHENVVKGAMAGSPGKGAMKAHF